MILTILFLQGIVVDAKRREACVQTVFSPSSPRLLLERFFGWYFVSSRMIPRKESRRPWTWLGSWFPRSVGDYKICVLVTLKKDHLYHLVDPEQWLNVMKASSITRQRLRVTFFVTFCFCCCCYKSFSTCLFHVTKWMSECLRLDWPLAIFLKCVSPYLKPHYPTKISVHGKQFWLAGEVPYSRCTILAWLT